MTELIDRLTTCVGLMSSDEIADMLTKLGVKGRRGESCECPWARFLRILTEEYWSVGQVAAYSVAGSREELNVFLPFGVSRFVKRFDRGDFPNLIDDSVDNSDW
jgi:hypothetical protein